MGAQEHDPAVESTDRFSTRVGFETLSFNVRWYYHRGVGIVHIGVSRTQVSDSEWTGQDG
jgi:hypothetical protein